MKKYIIAIVFFLTGMVSVKAQTDNQMNRIETCKENYRTLFRGEALTGQGSDPEMMDILQKFIFGEVFTTGDLSLKQREMITCVTLATMQTLPQLKAHAGAALNVGVTPLELREAMYLTAPFIGFPKMLNAVSTVNEVFKERGISLPLENQTTVTEDNRHEQGAAIQDKLYHGGISGVLSGIPGNLDDVSRFLTDYFFGEIYTRGTLDIPTKELLGYCILTTLEAESQLQSHFHGNIKAGNSPQTVASAVIQTLPYIGFPAAIKALRIIKQEMERTDSSREENVVRLSKITVDANRLDEYNAYLKEEIEASMRLEPGVLTLYAVAEKDAPNRITILEIYANRTAYESHLKTPHFQKYKQGTIEMVENLVLTDTQPLIPNLRIK